MENESILTRDDANYFIEMVGWKLDFSLKSYKVKPYTKLLTDRNSDNYRRFIGVYKAMRNVLSDREQMILDEVYGLNKKGTSLKAVAEMLNISPERVRQLRNEAENMIVSQLMDKLKDIND